MKTSSKGFTLIELLIVITIIGILAVAFLPSLLGAPAKARDTKRVADLQRIQKVLVNADLEGSSFLLSTEAPNTGCIDTDNGFGDFLAEFGGTIPSDPQSAQVGSCDAGEYGYLEFSAGNYSFGLVSVVEDTANGNFGDPADCTAAAIPADTGDPTLRAEDGCYYVVLTQ